MKLRALPHLYRNVKRWTEILRVLSRYGLADWLSRVNVGFVKNHLKDRDGEALARHTQEKRIRLALTELGPTFIKLGQLLSTRADLVGVALADELKHLREEVPADDPEQVRLTLEAELGLPPEILFEEFDDEPIASASIGQVHRARLASGEVVVIKVQHAGIESVVREDLEVLAGLAQLAERIPEFAPYRPVATVAEMSRTLLRELDFGREEKNLQQFAAMYEKDTSIRVPHPFPELSTGRVLTMEYIDGIKLEDRNRLQAEDINLEEVARRGSRLYLQMIFQHGFYHADPHPGNLLLLPGNVIGLLDFGMVGRIDEQLREDFEEMLMAILNQDVRMLTTMIKRVGSVPVEFDERGLESDVAEFVAVYGNQPLDQFELASALNEMTEIIRRYQISLPSQVALLLKALVTLEGTTRMLDPSFSVIQVMQPFHRQMLMRRFSPARKWRKLRRIYMELEELIEVLPRRMIDILEQVQSGRFDVHLDHRGLEPSVNRLVLGMLASALFLGSALLLSQEVPPLLFANSGPLGIRNISFLGLSGCAMSILLGLRLLRAIRKSGRLD